MSQKVVTKTIIVSTDPESCFRAFTQSIDAWWPKHHSRSGSDKTSIACEPFVGGRLFEATTAGDEYVFGSVVEWEPGSRLTLDWYLGTGVDNPSRVEIRFDESEDSTRITVTHFGADRIGSVWWERVQIFDRAWTDVLAGFAAIERTAFDR